MGGARLTCLPRLPLLKVPPSCSPCSPHPTRPLHQVREALSDFHASNYTSCLSHLDRLRWVAGLRLWVALFSVAQV